MSYKIPTDYYICINSKNIAPVPLIVGNACVDRCFTGGYVCKNYALTMP